MKTPEEFVNEAADAVAAAGCQPSHKGGVCEWCASATALLAVRAALAWARQFPRATDEKEGA